MKRQRQPLWSVLKILIEMFRKLNGFLLNSRFCSYKIFHWYLITDLIILKISLSAFLLQLPFIEVEAHFSGEHDRNSLTLYETMLYKGNPVEHLRWSTFAKIINGQKPLTAFAKKLHRGCSTGS